jgi:pre-mRNA-processing factor 40
MNGINGHTAPPALWQEARNADGRVYYYNTITKATQWNKPEELMTLAEASLQFLQFRLFSTDVKPSAL